MTYLERKSAIPRHFARHPVPQTICPGVAPGPKAHDAISSGCVPLAPHKHLLTLLEPRTENPALTTDFHQGVRSTSR